MNFTIWILNRIKTSILNVLHLGQGQWKWVREYRRLIVYHKGLSLLATTFGGVLWLFISFAASMALLDTKGDILYTMNVALYMVPAFYVYHWLAALYEIYDTERLATWERLKE